MIENGFWVFGYGSLVWKPEFVADQQHIARLSGFARSFCMRSIHHRGSVPDPGLVLALDQNDQAYCDGVAFHVAADIACDTIEMLRERELVSSAYLERVHPVRFRDGTTQDAICYVMDEIHEQYCGGLSLEEQAVIIAHATGGRGPNTEYLYNTAAHLRALGIEDNDLNWLEARVRDIAAR